MALWSATALSPEQKVQIVEEESDTENLQVSEEDFIAKYLQEDSESKSLLTEESGPFLGVQDVSMSIIYSSVHSIPVSIPPTLIEISFQIHWITKFVCWSFSD